MESPTFIARLLHNVPHVNITLQPVNNTFNPSSDVYIESLGILASIPAALLILSLVGLLLYLLTRCCDRKPRKSKSIGCQKFTLFTVTLLCCGAIGLGLYGNDDFHNGVLQVMGSVRKVEVLILNFRNQTEWLKQNLKNRRNDDLQSLGDQLESTPVSNLTVSYIAVEHTRTVKSAIANAALQLETILYLLRPNQVNHPSATGANNQQMSFKKILDYIEFCETIRWPAILGLLTFLLLLCTILMIGVARSSRCALILFSVFGLLGVTVSWLLSGLYLSSAVALGDFCMQPSVYICNQQNLHDIYKMNCEVHGTNQFILKLNSSRVHVDQAKDELREIEKITRVHYTHGNFAPRIKTIQNELDANKQTLSRLSVMFDRRTVHEHYTNATDSLCTVGLFGLFLMMIASLLTAFFLTILVCVDSHTWIYLTKKRPHIDKSETQPFLTTTTTTSASLSPTAPISSGTSTINRTLLHHQSLGGGGGGGGGSAINVPGSGEGRISRGGGDGTSIGRNGTHGMRGLELQHIPSSSDSPPPDYNFVMHGQRNSGHQTLGRLPSHASGGTYVPGPNNGKYATLSKQCKTLESNDCY